MSKRGLSPAPLPPAKRLHTLQPRAEHQHILTFENSIYDELVLCVFAHLSWVDLCVAQTVNKKWARLASDNEIWRRQYLQVFGRPRLRGSRGFVGRPDGREIKPLPGRAQTQDLKDWKRMFRISSNWQRGRCKVEGLSTLAGPKVSSTNKDKVQRFYYTNILVGGRLTITASSRPMKRPEIQVKGTEDRARFTINCESNLSDVSQITALAMDQSPPMAGCLRLASFLSTGEFTIWSLQPASYSRQQTYLPSGRAARTAPIVHAVYHHPLLVTLSRSFSLSVYDLSSDAIRHSQTVTSFTSFPPTSLVLSTSSPSTYRLILAYAIPVYPEHWSVGATELIIGGPGSSYETPRDPATSSETPPSSAEAITIRSTRTVRTIDVPHGWVDERKLRAMREQWSRKVSQITDTQTDGKWVVLAPGDRVPYLEGYTLRQERSAFGLQLYRLSLPPQTSSVPASPPRLTFVRTLHGQIGPITALALADGRCVSLGLNGSIWVWDLENGTGAEVTAGDFPAQDTPPEPVQGTVVFDERRIISALAGNVVVRSFDI